MTDRQYLLNKLRMLAKHDITYQQFLNLIIAGENVEYVKTLVKEYEKTNPLKIKPTEIVKPVNHINIIEDKLRRGWSATDICKLLSITLEDFRHLATRLCVKHKVKTITELRGVLDGFK